MTFSASYDFLNDQGIQDITQVTNVIILRYIQQRNELLHPANHFHTLNLKRQLFLYLYETGKKNRKELSLVVPNAGAPVTRHVPGTFSRERI